jgi:hypothetical protein
MIGDNEARVNITFRNTNGDLPDPVLFDTPDANVRTMLEEAIRTGGVPGVPADANVDLSGYIVERLAMDATKDRPVNMLLMRPKTEFGA